MKTRSTLFAFLAVLPLLLSSCNLPDPTATATGLPILGITATPPVPALPIPTSSPTGLSILGITATPPVPAVPLPTLTGPVIAHMPAGQGIAIMKIHMVDPLSGWGIGGLGQAQDHVFRTWDGGLNWRDVTPPQPAPAAGDKAVAIGDFRDASTAWVIYGTGMAPPPAFLNFWSTHDGGATWQYRSIDTSVSTEFFNPWFIDFVNATEGWLLVYLGAGMSHTYVALLNTIDGGQTWTTLVTPQDNNDIQACPKTSMVFSDVLNGWLARECNGLYPAPHILRTMDGGATWKLIEPLAPASAPNLFIDYACDMASPVPFSVSSVLMVMKCLSMTDFTTQKDYLYSTNDGGLTWSSYPMPAEYSLGEGLYFFDPQNGFAFGRRIYKTTDGGQTWTFVQEVTWSGQFSFVNANQGWASVVNDSSENALVKTINGGVRWEMLNPMVVP